MTPGRGRGRGKGTPSGSRPTIALDVSPVTARRTGVGVYAENLALALSEQDHPFDLALITNRPWELPAGLARGAVVRHPREPARPTAAWLQLTAPRAASHAGAAVAHYTTGRAPLAWGPPFVLTVHDLIALERPSLLRPRERALVSPVLARSVPRAAAIIAVSQATAEAVGRRFPRLDVPVHRIPEGVAAEWFLPAPDGVLRHTVERFGLGPRLWLHVGSQDRRKNLPRLCRAFALVLGEDELRRPQLVFAGPPGDGTADLQAAIAECGLVEGRDVIRTGFLEREELRAVVRHAELVACVSLYEGFGLPLVEAMAAGTPCLASTGGALPALWGDAALLVDPLATADIAAALLRLGRDAALRARLAAAGQTLADSLSWPQCAKATAAVYRQVLAGTGG